MKRRAVIWATFLGGLFYVLAFVLPPYFGGAADGGGASSATEATPPGSPALLVYAAARPGRPGRLLSVPLRDARGAARTLALAPSPLRRDDYHGARAPAFAAPNRLYYIGLGWDDKTPRVCLAEWVDGAWRPAPRAVLDRGAVGSWDATGITWISVVPPAGPGRAWRAWYVGRQGDVGRVGYAESPDGRAWRKAPEAVLEAPAGQSIESVSAVERGASVRLWLVTADGQGSRRVSTAAAGSGAAPVAVAWAGGAPPSGLQDLRVVPDAPTPGRVRLLATLAGAGGRNLVAAAIGEGTRGGPIPQPVALLEPGAAPAANPLSTWRTGVDDGIAVLGAFAVGLGLISLAQVHGRRVARRQRGWPESLVFFAAAAGMAGVTIMDRSRSGPAWGRDGYTVLFHGLFQPLGAAMFSLLAAYLVSAAYRAFKVRSSEGTLMAAAAVLIMLGQIPVGHVLTRSLPEPMQIPTLMTWVLTITNNAVIRAVNFGIFVGAIATALRVWLSLDRAFHQVDT